MVILERWDYTFKEGRKPHICTLVCALAKENDHDCRFVPVRGLMVIRGKNGEFTSDHVEFKKFMLRVPGPIMKSGSRPLECDH